MADDAIVLLDAPADSNVVISLPHSDASRYHTMVGVFTERRIIIHHCT